MTSTVNVPVRVADAAIRTGTRPETSDPGAFARGKRRAFAPFVVPALVLYAAILVVPTLATVVLSFTSWTGAGDRPKANGIENYRQMADSFGQGGAFAHAFTNTLIYIVVGGVGTFLLAFLFAMVLRDMRGSKSIRAILFFPNIVAPLALGMYFGFVFRAPEGLANHMLGLIGLGSVSFLSTDRITWVAMCGVVWASAGFYITIIMAAIDRIPPYLYEDASIAGATSWQKFRHVTLPLTWDVVGIAGVLWTISAVKIFEMVWVLAGPGTYSPPVGTWTMGVFVFDRTFGGGGTPAYGSACAVAVVMILLVTAFVLLLRRLFRREAVQF